MIAAMLIFQVTATFFQTFNLDALQFLRTSYQLSQQEDVQEWRQSVVTIHGEGFF
ncbi:hypothetical protein [Thalassobacillus sp. C254]|uniref:hypothetical protein n=1 Tax=Thalassobacillus sp. C254 TaxID=1225341 RepID=UPI0018DC1EAA|nr:hypothetical protein [Thalassobacillus sp. C254]